MNLGIRGGGELSLNTVSSLEFDFTLFTTNYYLWELDCKEGRTPKNWCHRTVVLEKTPESPLDSEETKPVNPKGNWPWIFIGRTDAEAEAPILWPPDVKSRLIGKDPDGGKDWGQKEKRVSQDEMAGWHHQCNGCELGQTSGDGEGQRGLVCHKLNNNKMCIIWCITLLNPRPKALNIYLTFAFLSCKLNCLKPNLICFTCQDLLPFQSSSFDSVPRNDCNF